MGLISAISAFLKVFVGDFIYKKVKIIQ